MALSMEAARAAGKRFVVLDRPNPIGGIDCEGSLLEPEFASFVGMYPIPMRHGLTAGELALLFNDHCGIGCDLRVVRMEGWRRDMWFDETGLPWVPPSPNMPTLDTATVYPGSVFFEGTEVSEGRGTTRPFEIVGAPYVDPAELIAALRGDDLPGVVFRPHYFEPTFHKFTGELCAGLQLHVTDRQVFKPVRTAIAIIGHLWRLYPRQFGWKQPPYEYVYDKLPFDVIAGTGRLRQQIEAGATAAEIAAGWQTDQLGFDKLRRQYFLYD
jgi:uncharacterized protein YbbC (DUF1343 family)